uniref:Enoyl Coenzyme A hydratase domain containing 1 n=1 Tax=Nothobranchius rachovii TaxID=451742 RepID=A0A1A8RT30_9TELE
MVLCAARSSLCCGVWIRQLQRRAHGGVYSGVHGFSHDEVRQKLEAFPGGSIDLLKQDSGLAVMTINNPSRMNAFSGSMMVDLEEKVTQLENWTDGKSLIVCGAAETFCSGSDLNAVRAISNPQDGMKMCMFMQNTLTRLLRLPLVSVAVVEGKAQNALKLLGGAVKVDSELGLHMGLADGVLEDHQGAGGADTVLQQAEDWLSRFTRGPAPVIQAVKKVVLSGRELPLSEALRTEKNVFGTVWGGAANLEALASKSKHR